MAIVWGCVYVNVISEQFQSTRGPLLIRFVFYLGLDVYEAAVQAPFAWILIKNFQEADSHIRSDSPIKFWA